MTSQAGRTVSGQSAGSGQWPEVAGSPPRQGTAGGTAPQSDAHRLRWRCGSWGRCGFREKRNGCARPGRRAPLFRPAPPSPRGPPATSAPRREATALGLRPPRCSLRSPVSLRSNPRARPSRAGGGPSTESDTPAFPGPRASLWVPGKLLYSLRMGHASPQRGFGERQGSDSGVSAPPRPRPGSRALPLRCGISKAGTDLRSPPALSRKTVAPCAWPRRFGGGSLATSRLGLS